MIARNGPVAAAASNAYHFYLIATPTSPTSSSSRSTRHWPCLQEQTHHYATVASSARDDPRRADRLDEAEHVWPETPKGHTCPTPYQIFDLKQNQQYSKARFYELVKIYHPDLRVGANVSASPAVRIERYRLLVAAHTILSDPVKRSAYDRFGSGWNGKAEVRRDETWGANQAAGPFSHNWNGNPSDPIWQNATWEDWERWHERRAGNGVKKPVFMKNGYFLACVAMLGMIGGTWNYGRAQDAGAYYVEQKDIVHDRAAKELRRVRQEKQSISNRQDRIDFFVRQRQATMGTSAFDVDNIREERAGRLLPNKNICRSEEVREKD